MNPDEPQLERRGARNFVIGALLGAVAGLLPGFLLWTMTGDGSWLAIGPLVLGLFGALVALAVRPFGS